MGRSGRMRPGGRSTGVGMMPAIGMSGSGCVAWAAGLVVVLSVSRAALAAFLVGTVMVMMGAYLQGVTVRRVALGVFGAVCGILVLAKAANTFMSEYSPLPGTARSKVGRDEIDEP